MSFLLCQACGGSCLHNMEYKVSLEMHLRFSRLYNCHSLKSCTIINFLPQPFPCMALCLGFVNRCIVNYRCTIRKYRGFSTQTLINIPSFHKWKLYFDSCNYPKLFVKIWLSTYSKNVRTLCKYKDALSLMAASVNKQNTSHIDELFSNGPILKKENNVFLL